MEDYYYYSEKQRQRRAFFNTQGVQPKYTRTTIEGKLYTRVEFSEHANPQDDEILIHTGVGLRSVDGFL